MELLRKLTFGLTATALSLSAVVLILSLFLVRTLANEDALKQQLKESGIYEVIANDVAEKISVDASAVPTDNLIVETARQESLSGTTVRKFSEDFISSTFSWLRGDVAQPTLVLRVDQIRTNFIESVTTQLRTHLESLPACAPGVIPPSTDLFAATCLPPGFSIDQQLDQLKTELQNDTSLASDQNITAKDITISTSQGDKPYYEVLSNVPQYYRWLNYAPWLAALALLILTGLLFLLGRPHEKGFRRAGTIFLIFGLLLIGAGIFIPQFTYLVTKPLTPMLEGNAFKEPVQNLAKSVLGSTGSLLLSRGILLVAISACLIALYILLSKRRNSKVVTGRLSKNY